MNNKKLAAAAAEEDFIKSSTAIGAPPKMSWDMTVKIMTTIESLPRMRGLTNLGNTCFFNAVLQCLAQTPYLVRVLKESVEAGEKFLLPGGILKFNDGSETSLMQIEGTLKVGGPLTQELMNTMEQLQSGGGVYNPRALLTHLRRKWPQFEGCDQHDSHELLRHLLESVRAEDLRRYQTFILNELGLNTKINPSSVEGEMKQKVKFYGNQATNHMDVMRRPDQVFKGHLVSTLTCQDCHHTSSRHESFLDISLPVNVEKPQPPTRRKSSPEPPSKHQVKKEKEKERKAKRSIKNKPKTEDGEVGEGGVIGENLVGDSKSNSSGAEQSDADVEDNVTDENVKQTTASSPVDPEKKDDDPENPDKDANDFGESLAQKNTMLERGLSADGCQNLKKMIVENNDRLSADFYAKMTLKETEKGKKSSPTSATATMRVRNVSHSDWSNTFGPRYQCEDGECSVQSCLNSFTSLELMTGQNKVGCENCTERVNGKNGKTVNTNATKQFLISIPPAVLILHLKRFQVGPRHMFRKLAKPVSFPFILDIAPFCGSKVKNQPNVNRTQKKILYSLYGIVEHSGTIHSGHYVAYVKVRAPIVKDDPRWSFLPQGSRTLLDQIDQLNQQNQHIDDSRVHNDVHDSDERSSSSSSSTEEVEGAVGGCSDPDIMPPPGKWYYISDSRVQEVSEESVKNTQAYLLFYERIY